MSRRIRLIVSYDGTNYVGWQLQENGVSIQQRLNEALAYLTGESIQVHGFRSHGQRRTRPRAGGALRHERAHCPRTSSPSR